MGHQEYQVVNGSKMLWSDSSRISGSEGVRDSYGVGNQEYEVVKGSEMFMGMKTAVHVWDKKIFFSSKEHRKLLQRKHLNYRSVQL